MHIRPLNFLYYNLFHDKNRATIGVKCYIKDPVFNYPKQTKLLDKEQESDRLRVQLQQKEQEIHDIRALYEKLNQERQNMSDVVRQEFADRLVALEEENRTVKRELAESKARLSKEQERHESDLTALKKANADELAEVHQKYV